MRTVRLVVLLVCTAIAAMPALAKEGILEADADMRIDGLLLGTHEYGEAIQLEDLDGKVVMIALWGG